MGVLLGLLVSLVPLPPGPQPIGPIWQSKQASIQVVPCPPGGDHDEYCRAVAVRDGDGTETLAGGGYGSVKLLWQRRRAGSGPDALVMGDSGGSGGNGDLMAITISPHPSIRKISGERIDIAKVRSERGPLRFDLFFDIEFFNGAPHAGVTLIPLPMRWEKDDFAVDLKELTARTLSPSEFAFRRLAMSEEFRRWASDAFPSKRLYPPKARDGTMVSVKALADLMLSGDAETAQRLLHESWPRDFERLDRALGGEDDFWNALCGAVVAHPYWKRFALDRLPHADLIEAGAAKASEHASAD